MTYGGGRKHAITAKLLALQYYDPEITFEDFYKKNEILNFGSTVSKVGKNSFINSLIVPKLTIKS